MPLSNVIEQYSDIRPYLDGAVANGGGRMEFPSYENAVRWRFRAYKFRKLWRERHGTSPWDRLVLRIKPRSNIIEIEFAGSTPGVEIKTTFPVGPAEDHGDDGLTDEERAELADIKRSLLE